MDSHRRIDDEDEELPPSCGPIRIRNLEDLVRQVTTDIIKKNKEKKSREELLLLLFNFSWNIIQQDI